MDELRAAAAMVRNAMRDGCYVAEPGQMERTERLLAQTYAMELDDTEITEGWLREIGFEFAFARWRIGTINLEVVAWEYNQRWYIGICSESGDTAVCEGVKTRGDVRRLMKALGIETR